MIGLVFECPFGTAHKNCPFAAVRQKPFEERVEYFEKLSPEAKSLLETQHRKCLVAREEKLSANKIFLHKSKVYLPRFCFYA